MAFRHRFVYLFPSRLNRKEDDAPPPTRPATYDRLARYHKGLSWRAGKRSYRPRYSQGRDPCPARGKWRREKHIDENSFRLLSCRFWRDRIERKAGDDPIPTRRTRGTHRNGFPGSVLT